MLLVLLVIPIFTIFLVGLFAKTDKQIFIFSYCLSILSLIHQGFILNLFDMHTAAFQFILFGKFGLDGISFVLVFLINLLMPLTILSCLQTYKNYLLPLIIFFNFIQFWCLSVFLTLDLLFFYISFEGVLIPMFLIILNLGSRNRKNFAAFQFFLYTLFGSLLLFFALISLHLETGTFDYQILISTGISTTRQYLLWLGFFFSLAIKIPLVPAHLWLLEAHVEAPTAASVILAAILLKLGSYGLIRYCLGLFPDACLFYSPLVILICLIGTIYSSLVALALWDIKKIIALSSISHMNLATIGIFTNSIIGLQASIFFLFSHGLISSALFFLVGILYDRYHTRTIKYYRSMVTIFPVFTFFFLFFTLANIAVPGTTGFISEFLIFYGASTFNPFLALTSTSVIVLTPCYALWLFHKISYGSFSNYIQTVYSDLSRKEFHLLLILALFTIGFGLYPNFILNRTLWSAFALLFPYHHYIPSYPFFPRPGYIYPIAI